MTNKAYIVANEQQEYEILEKLEQEGFKWTYGDKPTDFIFSDEPYSVFPYAVVINDNAQIHIALITKITNKEIVYDGRKEEQMSDKYVVSQEFMNKLKEWKDTLTSNDDEYKPLVSWVNLKNLPETVYMWWENGEVSYMENNKRLRAILNWVNGEDVFEVEKPKKWVVRSKDSSERGNHIYVYVTPAGLQDATYSKSNAAKFDTKEEAQSWANSHQEVIEVEE